MKLSANDQRALLRIARVTIREFFITGRLPPGAPHSQSLLDPGGVFVRLKRDGQLRGGFGSFTADLPIFRAVQQNALVAATRDPHFPPLSPDELSEICIEVSVVEPKLPITNETEITVGEHGLAVTLGTRHAFHLPQVAKEHGWSAATFLEKTADKAGLTKKQWAQARLEIFTAQVFAETP